MRRIPKYVAALVIVLTLIGCDQTTKYIAKRNLPNSRSTQYVGGLVKFQFVENEGGFLSLGSGLPVTLRKSIAIILTFVTLVGFTVLLYFAPGMKISILVSFSMLVGGAFGNLVDRLINQGRVIDFIILGTTTVHTGIFNVADVTLTLGSLMLIFLPLFQRKSSV